MTVSKKTLEISGKPMVPLILGYPALIFEEDGLRKTTKVLRLVEHSATEIEFETENTQYRLHIPMRRSIV